MLINCVIIKISRLPMRLSTNLWRSINSLQLISHKKIHFPTRLKRRNCLIVSMTCACVFQHIAQISAIILWAKMLSKEILISCFCCILHNKNQSSFLRWELLLFRFPCYETPGFSTYTWFSSAPYWCTFRKKIHEFHGQINSETLKWFTNMGASSCHVKTIYCRITWSLKAGSLKML